MKKIILIFCLSAFFIQQVIAQNIAEPVRTPTVFPSTPQSQLFEKYINHAVTEYNGLPEISIPLYTVEIKGVKIPITLSYHASGIKYKGYDGDIAAGWSLSAGGYRITRTIRGKADELFPLYDWNTFGALQSLEQSVYMASVCQDYQDAYKMFTITGGNIMRDGEYDLFSYMLPATNGQFLISDRNAKTIDMVNPRQDKIILDEGVAQLKLDNIKVIDNAGVQYFAGGLQNNEPLVEKSRSNNFYKTAWPVSRIVTTENESVNFSYKKYAVDMADENYYTFKIVDAPIYSSEGVGQVSIPEPEEQFDIVEEMYFVDKIETDKEKVEFIRQPGSHVLNKIIVTGLLDNKVITIDLSYSDDGEHRLLTNVLVNGKPYRFDYYDPPADLSKSFADQWGYYKYPFTGTGDFWGLYFHEDFKEHSFIEYCAIPGTQTIQAQIKNRQNYIHPNFVNREENANISYYSLKTIYFPTGGATIYEYEPHKYNKSIFGDPHGPIVHGGGQRVKKITSIAAVGSKPVVTLFKYGINENGMGKVDADNLENIKYKFFNDILSIDLTSRGDGDGFYPSIQTTVRTYSPKPMDADVDFECPVEYEQVTTYQYDEEHNTTLGKTVSNYKIPYRFALSTMTQPTVYHGYLSNDYPARYVFSYLYGVAPELKSRHYYRNNDEISREEYTYQPLGTPMYNGLKGKQKVYFDIYPPYGPSLLRNKIEYFTNGFFEYGTTFTALFGSLPASKTTTITENGVSQVTAETYEYNSRNQLSKVATTDSKNNTVTKEYTYPSAALGGIYVEMENRNILSPVIKEITKRGNKELYIKKTNFSNDPSVTTGLILPRSVQSSYTGAPNLKDDVVYEHYDNAGNPLQYVATDGIKVAAVWGYDQLLPIARVMNAEAKNVFHTSFEDADGNMLAGKTGRKSRSGGYSKALSNLTNGTYVLSWWQKNGSAWEFQVNANISVTNGAYTINLAGQVDEVRFYPAGAQMTTYTYDPLIGITGECDTRNKASYYAYDGYGRLQHIRDQDNNIIKQFDYNYAGPNGIGTVYTSTQSETYTAPCTVGGIGSSYTYTATGISLISPQDAYNKAIDDINLHGQSEANPTFFCTYYNDERRAWLQRTGCDEGLVGTWGSYWVNSGKYRSYISKADANAMADAEINANGPSSVGECVPPYVSASGFNWGPSGCYQIEFWDPTTGFSLWYDMVNGNNDLPRLPINTVDLQVTIYPTGEECDGVVRTYTVTCDGVTQSYTTSGIHLFNVSAHSTLFISIQ
jgi:YD repeat-containing protein